MSRQIDPRLGALKPIRTERSMKDWRYGPKAEPFGTQEIDLGRVVSLAEYQGYDYRQPIDNQGGMGSCASVATANGVRICGTIAGHTNVDCAPGPLYEWVRREPYGWFPDDTGGFASDNADQCLKGAPATIEPYLDNPQYDYNDDAWIDRESRIYIGAHRPFYPADGGFVQNAWLALDNGWPVLFSSYWPVEWYEPNGEPVILSSNYNPQAGHCYLCWGSIPGYWCCANSFGESYNVRAPEFGFNLRPGDFLVPWKAAEVGLMWEGRALSPNPVTSVTPDTVEDPRAICRDAITDIYNRYSGGATARRGSRLRIQYDVAEEFMSALR